jgi:hypothetical protein
MADATLQHSSMLHRNGERMFDGGRSACVWFPRLFAQELPMRPLRLSAVALTILALGFPVAAEAKLTRLEIASKQDYGSFRPGEFVIWEGRVVGELRPTSTRSAQKQGYLRWSWPR